MLPLNVAFLKLVFCGLHRAVNWNLQKCSLNKTCKALYYFMTLGSITSIVSRTKCNKNGMRWNLAPTNNENDHCPVICSICTPDN